MVVNFRARGISRGARKLARTPTIIKKKKEMIVSRDREFFLKIIYFYFKLFIFNVFE
jgi:hypothetical protein